MGADPLDQPFGTLPETVGRHANLAGATTALIAGDRRLTYAELDVLADRVAVSLWRDGLRPGDAVAICATNSLEFVMAYVGALRIGVLVALLPTMVSPESLRAMAVDSRAALLFVDETSAFALSGAGPAADLPRVMLDGSPGGPGLRAWLAPEGSRPPAIIKTPEAPCNIVYSSGTTSAPKGVLQSYAMRWAHMRYGAMLGDGAVMMISTPLYATGGSVSLLMALGSGGAAVLMAKFDAERFLSLAERRRATHATLVPIQYQRILATPDFDRHDLSSFRMTLSMGAASSAQLKAEILRRWPGGLAEIYGMTEGGGGCVLIAHEHPDKLHTVGRPGQDNDIRVIDDDGNELPIGEAGEVVGRSPIMMSGYHNRPDQTAEAEWLDKDGNRFIRSGDIGRFDEDGFLTIVDRKKDMIISGGFNVYSRDLEEALLADGQVQEAAVVGEPSERWGETPVAFVVAKPGCRLDPKALLKAANASLGKPQRLSRVLLVDELPRNAVGKIMKRELRARLIETSAG